MFVLPSFLVFSFADCSYLGFSAPRPEGQSDCIFSHGAQTDLMPSPDARRVWFLFPPRTGLLNIA